MSLEMTEPTLITQDTLIDSILDPYRALGPSLYEGYRSHAYRMLNFGRALALSDPKRDERLTVYSGISRPEMETSTLSKSNCVK